MSVLGPISDLATKEEKPKQPTATPKSQGVPPTTFGFPLQEEKKNWTLIMGGTAALVVAGVFVGWFFFWSPEARLFRSIDQGNLVMPLGQSAYDSWERLSSQMSPGSKAKVRESALPRISATGEEFIKKRMKAEDFSKDELTQFVRLYRWAIDLAPEDVQLRSRYLYAAGYAFLAENKLEDAMKTLRQSVDINPNWAPALNDLGRTYVRLENQVEAEQWYRKAIAIDPAWIYPQVNLAGIFRVRGDWAQAEESYLRVTQMDNTYATPWYFLGQVYEGQQRYGDALQAYERAIQLSATRPSSAFKVNPVQRHMEGLRQRIARMPAAPASVVQTRAYQFTVPATQEWTDTRLFVQGGARISFQATGAVHACVGNTCVDPRWNQWVGPGGLTSVALRNGIPDMALMVRIGNAGPYFVGKPGTVLVAPIAGTLYFGVNDGPGSFIDNGGSFIVRVEVN